jgi:SAM-dependent methyltransferase
VNPKEIGQRYDAIAPWWRGQRDTSSAGLAHLERAIALCRGRGKAIDVGCGDGRLTSVIAGAGFDVVGLDVSREMIALAQARQPNAQFIHADICEWEPKDPYDLIVAWDSTFHVPHGSQRPVLQTLCGALAPGGVLLFTAGGVDGEITGEMEGTTFYYSSLSDVEYLRIITETGCACVLLERDQYPEQHIVVIATRPA